MHPSIRLAAVALTVFLVGCPNPSTTQQTNTETKNNAPAEIKKTIAGKITRNGMANPKVVLVTTHGDTILEATTALLSLPGSSDSDRYPGFTAVKPAHDETYSIDLKLGSKAYTYGMLVCWNDANDDGKFSNDEVGGSAQAYNSQLKVDFVLSKTEYKEYIGDQASDVKAAYDWAFPEAKQSVTLKMANQPEDAKFAIVTAEGNSDAELMEQFATAMAGNQTHKLVGATVIAPLPAGNVVEIKLDKKPFKAVAILGWNDADKDGLVSVGEFDTPTPKGIVTGTENSIAFRLSSTDRDNLKVLKGDGTAAENAVTEYTWTFPAEK